MKRITLILFLGFGVTLGLSVKAYALGIGSSVSYGYSTSSTLFDENKYYAHRYSMAFILDTAVAMDKIFNYRLHIGAGYGHGKIKFYGGDPDEWLDLSATHYEKSNNLSFYDISCFSTFGFGIVRKEDVRFWIGPQIGLNFSDTIKYYQYEALTLSLGPVLGLNVNSGDHFTWFFDAGLRIQFAVPFSESAHIGCEIFISTGFLYRFEGDSFI